MAVCRTLALRPLVGYQTGNASRSLSMRRLCQIAEDARVENDKEWLSEKVSYNPRRRRLADLGWTSEDTIKEEKEAMKGGRGC